ncbi:MAG: 50S ribosomal protein L18 [Candidatus Woesearchaeota archaeon]
MATHKVYTVAYRRKREGKTDYKKRMKLLLGNKPRLVVRKSLKNISLQIIEFHPSGDKIVASAHSNELKKHGWKAGTGNTSAAYLTGLLLAKKTKKKTDCVLDIGQYTSVKGCILYAAAQGAADGGLQVPFAKETTPTMQRIRGEHIAAYAKQLKADKNKYSRQFSAYIKAQMDPETLPLHFDQTKKTIGGQ